MKSSFSRLKRLSKSLMHGLLCFALLPVFAPVFAQTTGSVFINEIHYDNASTDAGEAIEVAGPAGTDLTGWSIVLYNGSNNAAYDTDLLSGLIPNQQNGFGTLTLTYPSNGIQNGAPDAIALVNSSGSVVQFLSYEGVLTAVGGPADGQTSTDIGVSENGTEPLGLSLQLTGTGSSYADFTWSAPAASTFNAVNNGQNFSGGGGTTDTLGLSVSPTSFSEAGGASAATGTVTRTGSTATALTVNITSSDSTEATAPATVTIPSGQTSATFGVGAVDDTEADGNQTVTLSASATGFTGSTVSLTVTDNDVVAGNIRINDIQGAAQTSPLAGQSVTNVPGVVTVVRSNSFYFQDPAPDTDEATSEGLLVFSSSAPGVSVGDSVLVSGTVTEFIPGGTSSGNLSTTELTSPSTTVLTSGNALPANTVIGVGGRIPPTQIIDDDSNTTFDPATDGLDYYESLEGMLVQVNDAVAVGPTSDFGEIPLLVDNGENASVRSTRGGIVVRPDDFNPERVITDDAIVATEPQVNVGDRFNGSIVGVLDYSFGNFKLLNTAPLPPVTGALARESAAPAGDKQLSIATFNVENLDPSDVSRFAQLAGLIVGNLSSPDILSLEEVQDNNGATNDSVVDANQTYTTLIAAITAAGGPTYEFRQINPVDDQDGGEPGGNIRVGFLFNPARVDFIDRPGGTSTAAVTVVNGTSGPELSFSPGRVDPTNTAFANSRKPLAGEFVFDGKKVFVISNHFNSKGGDDPLFGTTQPPVRSSEVQRNQQAGILNNFVDSLVAADPKVNVIVLGDLNDFEFSNTLALLKGAVLTNLIETLPREERYTFIFDGNSQVLDHILLSNSLFKIGTPQVDIVHFNAEFADKVTDHEPVLARVTLNPPAPTISSFTPTKGKVGTVVTITGTNFSGATAVEFIGVKATFTVNSPTQITATVPAKAKGKGPITVKTPGGKATSSQLFKVTGSGK